MTINKKKYICTYFDYNFLPRGLTLYNSVKQFHKDFVFFVLSFDQQTYDYLVNLKYDNLIVISPHTYDDYFKINKEKFQDRKQYYFSATPNICIYLLKEYPEIDILLYLDSDVSVFCSLDPVYEELGDKSIGICSHRFHPIFKMLSKNYGKYNVGVNFFRNSKEGLECLSDWKKDCDSWYPNKPDYPLKFFSDQIFLDSWMEKYNDIKEINNIGVDVAPWNMVNYKFREKEGQYYANNQPLVIYHFSSLKKISDNKWNGNTIFFFGSIKGTLYKIYEEYINRIESIGLNNAKISTLTHKNSFFKKLFYFVMQFFMNEIIHVNKKKNRY